MYRGSCTYVRSPAGNTDQFSVAVGMHQGSALSPYLFLLIIDALTEDIQEEAPWCMLFADDIALVSEDGPEIQSRLEYWQQKLENVDLKIGRTKTEYMFCDFGGLSGPEAIALDGVALPVCSDFRCLGSLIQGDGKIDRRVKHRINTGWMKWRQVTGTICDPIFPLSLRGRSIRPWSELLFYMDGSECWAIKEMTERQLHMEEMRMLSGMCGITRMDRVRNEYIRGSLKVAPVANEQEAHLMESDWWWHMDSCNTGGLAENAKSNFMDPRAENKIKLEMKCPQRDGRILQSRVHFGQGFRPFIEEIAFYTVPLEITLSRNDH
ncbi:uncharacterized protein LOC135193495 [Vanessa tameamea]|uniref:Uncharacterized protein LOC135193495 n=1 Tax=Vanessa tameamea TaxID=334116 RepID=A0ABM4ALV0_VANTA